MENAPSKVRVTGKTIEQALVKAAVALRTSQDEVGYEIVSQKPRGIMSFFRGASIDILAWQKNSSVSGPARTKSARPSTSRRQEAQAPASTEPKRELSQKEIDGVKEDLTSFCKGICDAIAGESVNVSASINDGRLILDVDSDHLANQFTKNPKLAEAMEHILRKKPRYLKQELPFRIFLDSKGMRMDREKELIQMARDLSHKVSDNKRPIVLNYKSSYDRKIIHMALDKDDNVYTKSIGSGPNRKLMILPSKQGARNERETWDEELD